MKTIGGIALGFVLFYIGWMDLGNFLQVGKNLGAQHVEASMPEFARADDGLPIVDANRQRQPLLIPVNGETTFYVIGKVSVAYDTCQFGEVWGGPVDTSEAAEFGIIWLEGIENKPTKFRVASRHDTTCKKIS